MTGKMNFNFTHRVREVHWFMRCENFCFVSESIYFISYSIKRLKSQKKGVRLMSKILQEIKVLLWNRYGKQMYLVKTTRHKMSEILEIISYIQKINNEICSSFELPVIDLCKILVDCYEFEMQNINFYEMNQEQIMQVLGTVEKLKYHSHNKKSGVDVFLIELSNFWEVYNGQMVPLGKKDHKEIFEIIEAMVKNNPNSRPWLL